MRKVAYAVVFLAFCIGSTVQEELGAKREGKFFGLFQVVTFPNNICSASGKDGTCYTANECSSRRGTNAGTCANGFGVCCTFSINCGGRSSENCTYVESNSPRPGNCRHTVCPLNENICQLRLDFETFVVAGPSTNSMSETKILNGVPSGTGAPNSLASQCLTDMFSVVNGAGIGPAPICGINSGQHMYVDMSRSSSGQQGCIGLNFQLGQMAIFTNIPSNRQWSIKVNQIPCNSVTRAPAGCTQYFLENADIVQSYNYDEGQHLAFQRQTICVRRNKGQCRICWSAVTPEDFAVSGMDMGFTMGSICCGYKTASGKNLMGYDCLQIPGAMTSGSSKNLIMNSRFCGRSVGLVKVGSISDAALKDADITVCSTQTPFVIRFISDGFEEQVKEIQKPNKGFRIAYTQDAQNCR